MIGIHGGVLNIHMNLTKCVSVPPGNYSDVAQPEGA